MNKCIIYPNDEGGLVILYPVDNNSLSIEEIAQMDVPVGKPHKIINVSDIPADRTFRDAWEYQE